MKRKTHFKTQAALSFLSAMLFIFIALTFSGQFFNYIDDIAYETAFNLRNPFFTIVAKALHFIGSPKGVIIILAVLIGINSTRRNFGVPLAVCAALSASVNSSLKRFFMRERPDVQALIHESGFSFPSGHAMTTMALCTMAALILLNWDEKNKSFPFRKALGYFLLFFPLLMGLSRVYIGVHFLSDVLGGLCLGSALGILSFAAFHRIYHSKGIEKLNIPDE